MAHMEQLFFCHNIKVFMPSSFAKKAVLEIGSQDINGTIRSLFTDCDYTGIDIDQGKGVDFVSPGEDFGGRAHQFDTIISCEVMEHNKNWKETWINMIRMLKKDGLMVMTCASEGRKRHGTQDSDAGASPFTAKEGMNYYRNMRESDFLQIVNHDSWFSVWGFFRDYTSFDIYFFGVGLDAGEDVKNSARNLKDAFEKHYYMKNIEGRY